MRDIRQRFWAWNSVGMWVLFIMVPPALGCLWIGFQAIQYTRACNEFDQLLKGDQNARITEVAFDHSVRVNGRWERRTIRIDDRDAVDWLSATIRTARPGGTGNCNQVWVRMSSGGMAGPLVIFTSNDGEVVGVGICHGVGEDETHYGVTPPGPPPPELLPLLKG
jgi:hypothetical protein